MKGLRRRRCLGGNLRFLVVDDKADEVSVVGWAVAQPGQFDPGTSGAVGLKLQHGAFTWGRDRGAVKATSLGRGRKSGNLQKVGHTFDGN